MAKSKTPPPAPIVDYPQRLVFESDGTELERVDVKKEGDKTIVYYRYTKSITKLGMAQGTWIH